MKRNAALLLFCLLVGIVHAQRVSDFESLTVLTDKDDVMVGSFVHVVQPPIDTSFLHVIYRLTYMPAPDTKPRDSEWMLMIGARHTDFRSCGYARADTLAAANNRKKTFTLPGPLVRLEPVGEVMRSIRDCRFEVTQRIPFERRYAIRYNECATTPKWRMLDESNTISGYVCHAAETNYSGRKWKVWFTPAVPTDAGPWKLFGLPGLILRAEDATHSYGFELVKIEPAKSPIAHCGIPTQTETKRKWLRMECGFHGSPCFYFGLGGKHLFYTRGSMIPLGTEWRITYNPVEFDMAETEKPIE